mgnify:CR=1 FL=1
MGAKRKYSVTVVPNEDEHFSSSKCKCEICRNMHLSQLEWETFVPKTQLQKRMKNIINKLELEASEMRTDVLDHIPETLG